MKVPPDEIIKGRPEIIEFKHQVERLMERFPQLVPTSWWRDPYENAQAGGSEYSLHLLALAIDLDWPAASLEDFKLVGAVALADGLSGIIKFTPTKHYVHLQALPLSVGEVPQQFNILAPLGPHSWISLLWKVAFERRRATDPSIQIQTDDGKRFLNVAGALDLLETWAGL